MPSNPNCRLFEATFAPCSSSSRRHRYRSLGCSSSALATTAALLPAAICLTAFSLISLLNFRRAFTGVGRKRAEDDRVAELERKAGRQALEIDIEHTRLKYRYNGRDMRLTDVAGELIPQIVA